MNDILAYLESVTQPDSMGPEYSELLKRASALEAPIQKAFSLEYLDRLSEAQCDILRFERRECFSRGFRLGVRLLLAALE